jgi:hypothetical protein
MYLSRIGLALFVLGIITVIPRFGVITFEQSLARPTLPRDLETRVLVDSKGAIHVLWTVPPLNGSGSTPGLWYGKYEPNGTDAIPPTLIRNSSLVQAADMALDKSDHPHIAWAEGPAFANSSTNVGSGANSRLYYGEANSSDPRDFAPTPITGADKLVMWPSLAIDDNLTSHLVWTQLDVKAELTGGAYYARMTSTKILSQTTLIASFNRSLISVPRPCLAFDRASGDLHMAWVESDELVGGQVVSSVHYVQVDLRNHNVTRLQLARFDELSKDATVTSGPSGGAYVVWQQGGTSSSTRVVYVAQISRDGRIVFVKELAQPGAQAASSPLTASADSEDNLYVVWYQPGAIPSQPSSQINRAPTSVAYLKLDRDGSLSESGSELVTGPLIAVTVSKSGDLYAISQQGIVRLTYPTNTINVGLIGAAAVAASAMVGAITTEEVRYRMLLSMAPVAKSLRRKRKEDDPTEDHAIMRTLSRRPGLGLNELRDLLPREKPTMFKLALLERDGRVSSIRTGVTRRFYSPRNLHLTDAPLSIPIYETIPSRILHEVESNPGIWEAKLAQNLRLSQQIVHYHLRKLQAAEILTVESIERRKHYRLRGSSYTRQIAGPAS